MNCYSTTLTQAQAQDLLQKPRKPEFPVFIIFGKGTTEIWSCMDKKQLRAFLGRTVRSIKPSAHSQHAIMSLTFLDMQHSLSLEKKAMAIQDPTTNNTVEATAQTTTWWPFW